MRFFTILLVAAACSGGKQPSTTARSNAPDCKTVATKLAGDSSLANKDALANGLQSRCQTDHWSDDARGCLLAKGEAGPCVLTDAQRSGIEQERALASRAAPE
jgi:hypothetical protein